ncbi:hypothetical protein [Asanoa sp. NPDC050611]|uniref:hypothetical protein n=1 Tax=Asanoa sp. NPDC050611 TaxID=3157098 RepID=UPI0033C4CC10
MSVQIDDDDVVARLRAGDPGYPASGPDARRTLAAARRALRRRRGRQVVGIVAALLVGLAAAGQVRLPGTGGGTGYDTAARPDQGDPPVYPHARMLDDVARLAPHVLPVADDLGLTLYIDDSGPGCRVFTWSQGAFRDRDADCANAGDPEPPFDAASDAAFGRVTTAIGRSGVDVDRIEKGGWGPGTSFHLRDSSWQWNWYYSYVPNTPADAPPEVRTDTNLGPRRQVHVTGDWWFTVEPDD